MFELETLLKSYYGDISDAANSLRALAIFLAWDLGGAYDEAEDRFYGALAEAFQQVQRKIVDDPDQTLFEPADLAEFRKHRDSGGISALALPRNQGQLVGPKEWIRNTLRDLVVDGASPWLERRVVVVGESIHRRQMPSLPDWAWQFFGQLQERIFLDPGEPERRMALWKDQLHGREYLSPEIAVFLGNEAEFKSFLLFAQAEGVEVTFLPPAGGGPALFLLQILESLNLPLEKLPAWQSTCLREHLEFLIQA